MLRVGDPMTQANVTSAESTAAHPGAMLGRSGQRAATVILLIGRRAIDAAFAVSIVFCFSMISEDGALSARMCGRVRPENA